MPNSPFDACIFDMDGVLLDSEPFWRQAEREIFGSLGLHLTEGDCIQTMGVRIDEIAAMRYRQHPWKGPSIEQTALNIQDRVAELVREKGTVLPGVREALAFFREQKLPLALASSSAVRLINAVLEALDLKENFPVICSAEHEPYGKPHPAVFINTAAVLKAEPVRCLVIEDSLSGVIAAKAAKMTCIAVPEKAMRSNPKFVLADAQLESLEELPEAWEKLIKKA